MKQAVFEAAANIFAHPASRDEYARRFTELLAERFPLKYAALALASGRDPLAIACATGKNGARARAEAAISQPAVAAGLPNGEPLRIDSTLFFPLATGSAVDGLVVVERKARALDDAGVRQLSACVRLFGLALGNAELQLEVERLVERSTDDRLTGVHNRRGFDERLRTDWKRAMRDGTPVAVALIDIDHFGEYDETYGPERRDECLRQVARAIAAAGLRSGDYVARFDGHEFAVIMPAGEEGALALCDRIRRFVALRSIEHGSSPYGIVTVSVGVCAAVPSQERSQWSLVGQADVNLNRAKHAGRNRVAGDSFVRTSPLPVARAYLPPHVQPFAGRSRELAALSALDAPWLTICGPAGIGKTALAIEAARRLDRAVTFIDLAGATGAAIATRIDEAVRNAPHDEPLTLLLDGCDSILAEVAAYATGARERGSLRVLATSRVPLGVTGETIFELGPLEADDASRFFESCAGEPNPELVELLGGIPFALEFAACALYAERGSAYARLLAGDDAVGRAIGIALKIAQSTLPQVLRVRAMAVAAHAAHLAGDAAAVRSHAGWLRDRSHGVHDRYVRHLIATMECIALVLYDAEGEAGLERAALACEREMESVRHRYEDLFLELVLVHAVLAQRSGRRAVAKVAFDRVTRATRTGAAPDLAVTAALWAAAFDLAENAVEGALSLLLDVTRYARRVPSAAATADALTAYALAASQLGNAEASARLREAAGSDPETTAAAFDLALTL